MNHLRAILFTLICIASSIAGSIPGSMAMAQTTAPSMAPDSVLPDRPDRAGPGGAANLLGDTFASTTAGISFGAPARWKEIRHRGAVSSEIVQYLNEPKHWSISVNRLSYNPPVQMTYHKEKNLDGKGEHDVNGLFEETLDRLNTESPGIEIDRREIVQMNGLEIGMIAARTHAAAGDNVTMIALLRRMPVDPSKDKSSRIFYSFNLNAPVAHDAKLESDPDVHQLADTFNQMIETVKLLDQSEIREDQDERLFRTRALFVNLTEPVLRSVMVPEQWLRIQRDGKDVGYMYIVEEVAADLPRQGQPPPQIGAEGVLIGVRTRMLPESGEQINAESWEWCGFDRKNEKWTTVTGAKSTSASETYTEIGSMQTQIKLMTETGLQKGEETSKGLDAEQPAVRQMEVRTLDVFFKGKEHAAPSINQTLPAWYLPQPVLQLLPRVLAKYQGKTYMFAAYSSDNRAVMARYVDVDLEQAVDIDGRHVNAIPVNDRWGWDGSITTHYVTKDGKYLGSINKDSKIMIVPTDRATLQKIWENANLSRPKDVDGK